MAIIIPRLVSFDSSTLGKVSRDYRNKNPTACAKAEYFLEALHNNAIIPVITFHHITELLRHQNDLVCDHRLLFLRSLPQVAWLRPYDEHWFPGGVHDLFVREIHAFVHTNARTWSEIISATRARLWETGAGSEMFEGNSGLWDIIRSWSRTHLERQREIASIARTDASGSQQLRLSDFDAATLRLPEELPQALLSFADTMRSQLDSHGDAKLDDSHQVVLDFLATVHQDVNQMDLVQGDAFDKILHRFGVPRELVTENTTVSEMGELAILSERLKAATKAIKPNISLSVKDISGGDLPSYALERSIARCQNEAERVSGSDLGDTHMIPLIFYTDAVELDKRTIHHLSCLEHSDDRFAGLYPKAFKSGDYCDMIDRLTNSQ